MSLPRLDNPTHITDRLNELAAVVKTRSRASLTDANYILETIAKRLFNALFGWDLVNLNIEQANYPAADLGDRGRRIAVQVTNEDGSDKIAHTASKAIKHHLGKDFDRLIIFFLLSKKPRLPKGFVQPPEGPKVETWDIADLLSKMRDLSDLDALHRAAKVLDEEMGRIPAPDTGPTVTQSYVSLVIRDPHHRTCNGQFLASNKGSSICNIEDIRLFAEGITLPEYNLVAVGHQPGSGVNKPGTQKLPLSVLVSQPVWVYFRTVEIDEVYRGELPETVILKVFFDCVNEPVCKTLKRVPGNNQYREE